MKSVNVILRLLIGLIALGLGIYRFHYVQPDWRSALIIVVGIWFIFRAYQLSRATPSRRP